MSLVCQNFRAWMTLYGTTVATSLRTQNYQHQILHKFQHACIEHQTNPKMT